MPQLPQSQGSTVGIVSRLWTGLNPCSGKRLLQNVQASSGAHAASHSLVAVDFFIGFIAAGP